MNDNKIEFYEANKLIQFFMDHAQMIRSEKINNIYMVDMEPNRETIYGTEVFDVDDPVILEFDTLAVKISYYYWSEAIVRTMPLDEFEDPKERREGIKGLLEADEKIAEYASFIDGGTKTFPYLPIKDMYIERFSDEFVVSYGPDEIRPAGGDYFKTVILRSEDYGILISGEHAEADGRMNFAVVDKETTDHLIGEQSFEHIII